MRHHRWHFFVVVSLLAISFLGTVEVAVARDLPPDPPTKTADDSPKQALMALIAVTLGGGLIFMFLKIRSSKSVSLDLMTAVREAAERARDEANKKPD